MAFRLGLRALTRFCHQMGVMLESGLALHHALTVAERGAPAGLRPVYRGLAASIEGGCTFSEALDAQGRRFPVLLRRLVQVGETAGKLDAVMKRTAEYYTLVRRIWLKFLTSLIWPLIEYVAMVLILAAMTYLRGILSSPQDPDAGFKAMRIIVIGVLVFVAPIALYVAGTRLMGGMRGVHEVMMRIPVVAMVMRAMGLGRFAWCMEMMTDTGVPILQGIAWSMEATANRMFIARTPRIVNDVRNGIQISEAFRHSGLFPPDFVEMIYIGETSGKMPEMFRHLSRIYFEKLEDAMKVISVVAFWVVWGVVAGVIIYFIFTLAIGIAGVMGI